MTAKVVDIGQQYGPYVQFIASGGVWKNVTATGVVVALPCALQGFYVNSTNAGTITLYDSATTNANPVGGLITPAIGWRAYPIVFKAGLYAVIGGTALDVTFSYLT